MRRPAATKAPEAAMDSLLAFLPTLFVYGFAASLTAFTCMMGSLAHRIRHERTKACSSLQKVLAFEGSRAQIQAASLLYGQTWLHLLQSGNLLTSPAMHHRSMHVELGHLLGPAHLVIRRDVTQIGAHQVVPCGTQKRLILAVFTYGFFACKIRL